MHFCQMEMGWWHDIMPAYRSYLTIRCGDAGHALLPNGNGLVVGGDNVDLSDPFLVNGFPVIRLIDPFGQAYTRGPDMPTGRWYPHSGHPS